MADIKGITIELGLDDKSKLKLRAIAKHAGALADELDRIDKYELCPKCGSFMNTSEMFLDNELKSKTSECECGFVMGCDFGSELPTHIESSE